MGRGFESPCKTLFCHKIVLFKIQKVEKNCLYDKF